MRYDDQSQRNASARQARALAKATAFADAIEWLFERAQFGLQVVVEAKQLRHLLERRYAIR